MAQIEITVGKGNPSVKINGKEMNGLINELSINIKPMIAPTLTVKMTPESLITVCENASLVLKEKEASKERTYEDLEKAFSKITSTAKKQKSDEKRFEEMKRAFTKFIDDKDKSWKKDFLTKKIPTSDTPINHDPPEGYVHISDLKMAVSEYIFTQKRKQRKTDLANPFVPDQPLSEFIKTYWSEDCDPENDA